MKIEYIGKCLLLDSNKTLVVGDLHFGYGESMRKSGIMLPDKIFEESISEMDEIFNRVGKVERVVLLGDLKHEFGRVLDAEWREIKNFIDYLSGKCEKVVIVKGNHDQITKVITEKKGVDIVDYYISGGVAFVHGDRDFPEIYDKGIKHWIMGHGHPAVRISDGVKEEKYKCFLVGKYKNKEIVIVPSFFSVNEGTDARDFDLGMAWPFDLKRFEVKIVGDGEVLDFGRLGKL